MTINHQLAAHELAGQMKEALDGIAAVAVQVMARTGEDLVDGISIGIRAGKMAEAMARANTARRVRDLDGYRRALREASAYVLGALLEIGEPVILPPDVASHGVGDPFKRYQGLRFKDTEAYRAIQAERQAQKEQYAAEAEETIRQMREDGRQAGYPDDDDIKNCPVRQEGYPDVVCHKGFGHRGPCHPLNTTVSAADTVGFDGLTASERAELTEILIEANGAEPTKNGPPFGIMQLSDSVKPACDYQAGQMVCRVSGPHGAHDLVDPFRLTLKGFRLSSDGCDKSGAPGELTHCCRTYGHSLPHILIPFVGIGILTNEQRATVERQQMARIEAEAGPYDGDGDCAPD